MYVCIVFVGPLSIISSSCLLSIRSIQFSRSHPMHDLKFSFNGHNLQEVEVMWNFVAFCCRIFQFENFARTKKRVLAREPQGGALVGGRGIDVYEFQPQTFFPGLCSLVGMSAYILAVCPGALQASVTACCCFSVLPHINSTLLSFPPPLSIVHRDISTNPLVVFGLLQHENKVRYKSCCSSLCVIQLP